MSLYILSIGDPLANVLERAAKAQPAQFAGYGANLDFWVAECEHFFSVVDSFEERFQSMRRASENHLHNHPELGNLDDLGEPYQTVRETTTDGERKRLRRRIHTAMTRVLDRAFDLRLLEIETFDDLNERLTTGAPDTPRK
jgi:hypothetical protein